MKGANSITPKPIDTDAKAELVREYADDMKALDIEVIDVSRKTSVTSRLVICTGTSDTHVSSIADRVFERMKHDQGIAPVQRNMGPKMDGWVVVDYGDVVFHCFREEKRQFYDLEALWKDIGENPDLILDA